MTRFLKAAFVFLFIGNSFYTQAQLLDAISWVDSYQPEANIPVGGEITLSFEAVLDPGFHIYSSVVSEGNPGGATTFELDETTKGISLDGGMLEFGHPETYYDTIFLDSLTIFHDMVTFKQKIKIEEENPLIEGYIRYQICDDSRCIPSTFDFSYALKTTNTAVNTNPEPTTKNKQDEKIATPPARRSKGIGDLGEIPVIDVGGLTTEESGSTDDTTEININDEQPSISEQESTNQTVAIEQESTGNNRSLWSLLVEGFLFGLASVLTPCIFPMIPLTVSFFTKRTEKRSRGIRDAAVYGGSIVLIYTGLALGLSAIFGPTVMQKISINPWFNLAFFSLLVVFALSFMGMFEITLPSSWSTAASKGGDRGGLGGVFLMALSLAIVSFSCTGPIVATALGDAFYNGAFLAPSLTMLSFSTALALPFVLFAIFPNWLNALPKSGGWLNAVKVTLGLLELALALIYFSRADLTKDWGILSREAFIGAWVVIFTILGFYLLGKIRLPHDDKLEKLSVPRLLLAMASFWFVLYLIPGLWGTPLKMLGGYMPSSTANMGVLIQEGQGVALGGQGGTAANEICNYPAKISSHLSKGTPRGFCAFYDLEQGLAYAKEVNKPVFLDFTGHNCVNCRYLEKNAWVDPQLRKYLTEEYVMISLYVDDMVKLPTTEVLPSGKKLRTVGDKWLQYQVDTYQSNAQPLYVLLDHNKQALVAPMGYNPPLKIDTYVDFFERGLQAFEKNAKSIGSY